MDEILMGIIRGCKGIIKRKSDEEEFRVDRIIIDIESEKVSVLISNLNKKLVYSLKKIRSDFTSEEP